MTDAAATVIATPALPTTAAPPAGAAATGAAATGAAATGAAATGVPAGGMPMGSNALLAGEHFIAAACFLLAGAIGLVWIAPELTIGAYPSAHVAGVTHLFTLGWLTTTILGAYYQLLPVALAAPIRFPRLGHASFAALVPGVASFATGVMTGSTVLHHVGICLVAIAIVLATVNVGWSIAHARKRDETWAAVVIALTMLCSTLVLGGVLLHNLHTGFLAAARVRVLAIHLHVALVGWVLVTIVGMSHRLLPMFLLAHGVSVHWTRRALALLTVGIATLAAGLAASIAPLEWLGVALLDCGVAAFLLQARIYFRARLRRRLDVGMRFASVALCLLASAAALGPFVLAFGATSPRLATAYVVLGLLGGIVLYVAGYFYKIVPFLVWIARFHGRVGRGRVPAVADLYVARVAQIQLFTMSAGVIAITVGVLAEQRLCTRAGAALFLAGVLLFGVQGARLVTAPAEEAS